MFIDEFHSDILLVSCDFRLLFYVHCVCVCEGIETKITMRRHHMIHVDSDAIIHFINNNAT